MWQGFDFEPSAVKPALFLVIVPNMAMRIVTNYLVIFTVTTRELITKNSAAGEFFLYFLPFIMDIGVQVDLSSSYSHFLYSH